MEIERKFLVKNLPELTGLKSSLIVQGYVSISPEVRIRKKDDKYFLTKKGEGTLCREEIECEVSKEVGEEYFSKVISNLVEKTRYYINIGKNIAELDIYKGIFNGLVVVEVEFDSLDELNSFIPPSWFGEDISENVEYRNRVIAMKSIDKTE